MKLSRTGVIAAMVGAAVLAATVISPAIGGPSLKKLVKNEVSKQLANKQGPAGPAGQQGVAGANVTANSVLQPGETLTGVWAVAGGVGATSGNAVDAIQFVPQLPAPLGMNSVHRLAPNATSAACPGPGQAASGQLCVYEVAGGSGSSFNFIGDPAGTQGANRRGAVIWYTTSAASGNAQGTWAVTP